MGGMIPPVVAFSRFILHDLRLTARRLAAMFGGTSPSRFAIAVVIGIALLHAAAWPVGGRLVSIGDSDGGRERVAMILAGSSLLVVPWIVAQSMTALTRALFGRSDLELILASPANPCGLFAARAIAIAIDAVASVALLLAPVGNVMAAKGHPRWLALYPALIAAGLAGTGLGIILAMGLFLAAGPRRARLFSQIAATAVGASFALGAQAVALLPDGARAAVLAMFAPPGNGAGAMQRLIWTPARAAGGEPSAMLAWAAFGAGIFAVACTLFGERFAQAAVASAGALTSAGGPLDRTARFGAGVGAALRAKERRVVWRDPWLMSQLLLQAAYTMPVAVILWRGGGATATVGLAFTPALVVIAAQLAGALAWVALSAEDAPDFLKSAPISRAAVERGKMTAIGQPIALILALPVGALAFAAPWAGFCAVFFGAGAVASSALVNLWRQAPSRRSLVLRRHSQSKLVGLMEHLVSILWAVATAIAVIGSWTVVVPLAAVAAVLAINRKWAGMEAAARG